MRFGKRGEVIKLEYPSVWAWWTMVGFSEERAKAAASQAKRDGAPLNAIFQERNGRWVTSDQIVNAAVRKRFLKTLAEFMS